MRDAELYARFNSYNNAINALNGQLRNLGIEVERIKLYMKAVADYDRYYWWIPKTFYPGNKIFAKIHGKIVKEHVEKIEKRIKETREKAENKSRIQIVKGNDAQFKA